MVNWPEHLEFHFKTIKCSIANFGKDVSSCLFNVSEMSGFPLN